MQTSEVRGLKLTVVLAFACCLASLMASIFVMSRLVELAKTDVDTQERVIELEAKLERMEAKLASEPVR